jgi:quercetin dioxygenase-like cupin family protein
MTTYPLQINNGHGEILTFERLVATPNGDRLEISVVAQPQSGPPMHVHWQQEEGLTVVTGRLGYQIKGEAPRYAEAGETVVFAPGVAHRWWVEGDQPLHGTGYVEPAHNMVYFLSEVYRSMRANGGGRPAEFDAAYLLHKYRSEFAMLDIPPFVVRFVFPVLRLLGRLTGRFKRFEGGPAPL